MNSVRSLIAVIAVAGLGVATNACAAGSPPSPTAGAAIATVTPVATPPPPAAPTFGGQVIDIVAKDRLFSVSEIEVAAGAAFEIRFENQDPFNHAIYIVPGNILPVGASEETLAGSSAFRGDWFAGPGTIVYHVSFLPAGTYTFFCPVHVPQAGIITAK